MAKISEEEKNLLDKGWIKIWLLFEVVATKKEATEGALEEHVKKLKKEDALKVFDENFTSTEPIEPAEHFRAQGITETWSQLAELIVYVKDFETIMNMVVTYGPTAIEILAPEKISIDMRSAQNALATVTDLMHKYAAAGIGGMLISTK